MSDWSKSLYPSACRIVFEAGINPATVLVNAVDEDGYEEIQFDDNGRRVIQDGQIATIRRKWKNRRLGRRVTRVMAREHNLRIQHTNPKEQP